MTRTFIPLTSVLSVAKMTLGSSSSGHGVLDGVTHRKGGRFPFVMYLNAAKFVTLGIFALIETTCSNI